MAVIKPVPAQVGRADESAFLIVWPHIKAGDTCDPISAPNLGDKSIHAAGNFGGGSVSIWGSNNGFATPGVPLRMANNTVIALTAEAIRAIAEDTVLVKPVVAGGGAAQDISVYLLCKQNNPLRQ